MAKLDLLSARELDHLTALALGVEFTTVQPEDTPLCGHHEWSRGPLRPYWVCTTCFNQPPHYATDWAVGGPVVDVMRIGIGPVDEIWVAYTDERGRRYLSSSKTPLRAAMQALVISHRPDIHE
jgi:hypothetical protein